MKGNQNTLTFDILEEIAISQEPRIYYYYHIKELLVRKYKKENMKKIELSAGE